MGRRNKALQDELSCMDVIHRHPDVRPLLSVLSTGSDGTPSSKQGLYVDARNVFRDVCAKNLDWSEALWEAWVSFEQLHGSVEEFEDCLDRIERAQFQVAARRAKVIPKFSIFNASPLLLYAVGHGESRACCCAAHR